MRRSLIITVAAAVALALVAMLVPMAVLVQAFALEDRLSRAALEVQATETVVSGQDKGAVAVYLDRVNGRNDGTRTTVLYPDGTAVGPTDGEDDRVRESRRTGQARVDDTAGGAEILVPVSLGGSSTVPEQTPVVRVEVMRPGASAGIYRAWAILAVLAVALLVGAVALADRLGRSFVDPIRALASASQNLGGHTAQAVPEQGPPEVRELGAALNRLVERIETLLERERRGVSDLSHQLRTPVTALRLRIDGLADPAERHRLGADVDHLEGMVDHVVREARRSEREGLVAACDGGAVVRDRLAFWAPLAEDQGRSLRVVQHDGPAWVRAGTQDVAALVDVLMDNVFTHTEEGAAVEVQVAARPGGGLQLVVDDAGPGWPVAVDPTRRGASGAGSTGLGLSIAARTAQESGGSLRLARSPLGGARVEVLLGPPA